MKTIVSIGLRERGSEMELATISCIFSLQSIAIFVKENVTFVECNVYHKSLCFVFSMSLKLDAIMLKFYQILFFCVHVYYEISVYFLVLDLSIKSLIHSENIPFFIFIIVLNID